MNEPVDRTSDGRYIIVAGRRWRASDPNIPEIFRAELVAELMDARRAVKSAKGSPELLAAARSRVHNAKVSLGERGEAWWVEPTPEGRAARLRATILALLTRRGPGSAVRPSDVARIGASPNWRPVMDTVRAVGAELAQQGLIRITQGDVAVEDPTSESGLIRYRLPKTPDSSTAAPPSTAESKITGPGTAREPATLGDDLSYGQEAQENQKSREDQKE